MGWGQTHRDTGTIQSTELWPRRLPRQRVLCVMRLRSGYTSMEAFLGLSVEVGDAVFSKTLK